MNPNLAIHSGEKHTFVKAGRYASPDCYANNLVIKSGRVTSPDSESLKMLLFTKSVIWRQAQICYEFGSQLGEIKYLI